MGPGNDRCKWGPFNSSYKWEFWGPTGNWFLGPTLYVLVSLSQWTLKKKSLNFIFPTKYVIPKSLKFSHWTSKLFFQPKIVGNVREVFFLKQPPTLHRIGVLPQNKTTKQHPWGITLIPKQFPKVLYETLSPSRSL